MKKLLLVMSCAAMLGMSACNNVSSSGTKIENWTKSLNVGERLLVDGDIYGFDGTQLRVSYSNYIDRTYNSTSSSLTYGMDNDVFKIDLVYEGKQELHIEYMNKVSWCLLYLNV